MYLGNHWTSHSLPLLLALTLLTVIFSHFRGMVKSQKFCNTEIHSSRRKYIYLVKRMELATFTEVLAQRLPGYNLFVGLFCETSWFVQSLGIKWHAFGGLFFLSFVMELKLMLANLTTAVFKLWSRD